jgi:hypothetical protein
MAQTTCRQCDAKYNSERELRNHLGTAWVTMDGSSFMARRTGLGASQLPEHIGDKFGYVLNETDIQPPQV